MFPCLSLIFINCHIALVNVNILQFQAESRLAQRRQARAEAREIRMRELEVGVTFDCLEYFRFKIVKILNNPLQRQQKEQEQNADRVFDMQTSSSIDPLGRSRLAISSVTGPIRGNSMSSRRSSEDSLEEEGRSLRDIRHELKVNFSVASSCSLRDLNSECRICRMLKRDFVRP